MKYLITLSVALLVASPVVELRAQILNAPQPQTRAIPLAAPSPPVLSSLPMPIYSQATPVPVSQPALVQPAVQQPAIQQPAIQQAGGATVAAGDIEQTGWSMPQLTLPKLKLPNMESVTVPLKAGASKVKAGTMKAWEGTKDIFSITKKKAAPRSRRAQEPKKSFWKRLLVREPEYKVPQTVGEFMSQPKLNP